MNKEKDIYESQYLYILKLKIKITLTWLKY